MKLTKILLLELLFILIGCDPFIARISVHNLTQESIDIKGDYYGRSRIGDNLNDSVWHEQVKINSGDSADFFPISWNYELDSLKITVKWGQNVDSTILFDSNAIDRLYEYTEDSVVTIGGN